jgi:hypothetical protein
MDPFLSFTSYNNSKIKNIYLINQLKHVTFLVYNRIWKSAPNACSVSTLNGKGNPFEKEFL